VLDPAKAIHPTITMAWVDQGFKNSSWITPPTRCIDADVVTRNPEARGCTDIAGVCAYGGACGRERHRVRLRDRWTGRRAFPGGMPHTAARANGGAVRECGSPSSSG
jgi:hypothetical protein